ncbi:Txe/YoeB family addiction module toxin [Paracidovorax avenae]|uniref:Putative mRNA interferase YoeB n=1 Tax=Paracidovorax anthurii TaxID=78229 RepID=A0A328ZFS6_9BURK|nr:MULTISPECIES: Txe/YoeB family addiction module toxin [Paracidovorax]AVS61684.1 Txe/YoeB family addiction module toxin [Paracidovorax avenae]RAR85038.1 toxin YoeB [Paracidovorax anthurii]
MSRAIKFLPSAWEDYLYWQGQDKKTLKRINALLNETTRDPFVGTGKPEPLVGNLAGYWSRRIDQTNRLVYRATDEDVVVLACRYHYDD